MKKGGCAGEPLIGAHMSIAGGLHHAILAAASYRCRAVQIFSKSSNQWRARSLTEDDVAAWREHLERHPMIPMVHDSYLINLASPDPVLLKRSRDAFLEEVQRCDRLSIPYLIFHPGAHVGAGEKEGMARIAESLDLVCAASEGSGVVLLLETTAGQGTSIGHRFEQLARICDSVRMPERLGVCFDTCHVYAAGYDLTTEEGYAATFEEFDRRIGCDRIKAFHINDSKRELGSRVDRHQHIGRGFLGKRAFALLLRDPRFRDIPKVLETEKTNDMDRKNLALLRKLARAQ